VKRIESAAVLVRSVPYGEADLIATFFTETDGTLPSIVRSARRSAKRFGGAIEPIHELSIVLEDKGRDLLLLKEARIERARIGLTTDLGAMDAAGQALRWIRHFCPPRTPEPAAWGSLAALLDDLDAEPAESALPRLAGFGLRLLADVGYALDLERCVRCGRPCPEGRPAMIDAARGGLVCTSCGGARRTVRADARALARRLAAGESVGSPSEADVRALLAIIEDAMAAHAGFDRSTRDG
jgi:DNA repair protein RecO (recombination protein O)